MDSNYGSQEQETIAKFLEDDITEQQNENEINGGDGKRHTSIMHSQPNNVDKGHVRTLGGNKLNGERGLLGGIDTQNKRKRGYDELMVQTAGTDSQVVRPMEFNQYERSATSRESFSLKRQKIEKSEKLMKVKSHIEKQIPKLPIERENNQIHIPANQNLINKQNSPRDIAFSYSLEYVRETKNNAQNFKDLVQHFAKITIRDQISQNKDQMSDENRKVVNKDRQKEDIIKVRIDQDNRQKVANDFERFVHCENLRNMLKITDLLVQNNINKRTDKMGYDFEVLDVNKFNEFLDSYDDDTRITQILEPHKHMVGKKVGNKFYCDQQMFRRVNPDGDVHLLWILHNVGTESFLNKPDDGYIKHFIESGVFQSHDGIGWRVRFQPGDYTPALQRSYRSKICLIAVPSSEERKQKKKPYRLVTVKFGLINNQNNKVQNLKHWCLDKKIIYPTYKKEKIKNAMNPKEQEMVDEDQIREKDENDQDEITNKIYLDQFCQISNPKTMRMNGTSEQFMISINISHQVKNIDDDEESDGDEDVAMGVNGDDGTQRISQKPVQLFKGLKNEGTTCYLNSVIQALFFIRPFRNAIYRMPTVTKELNRQNLEKSIPFCLQRIFYNMQLASQDKYVRTHELLQAFGWDINDINQQQDVSEFNQILSEQLDKQMEGTAVSGTFQQLFQGEIQSVIKCINVEYESTRCETFNNLQLTVKGNQTIQDSFRKYMAEVKLDGRDQYETDQHGKQDAVKFIRFKKMPPILQIQLTRYDFDPNVGNIVKENQQLKFQDKLDFGSIKLDGSQQNNYPAMSDYYQSQATNNKQGNAMSVLFSQYLNNKPNQINDGQNIYHLHSILVHRGSMNSGHYFAFIKPTLEDRWYEFNDDRVTEVTKERAFGFGIGGENCSYEVKREQHEAYPDSTGMLVERHRENFTNAYMLIYIRDSERASILDDQRYTLDKQIPKELQLHFKIEEMFNEQIKRDQTNYKNFSTVFMISDELIKHSEWSGSFICPKVDDKRNPPEKRFECDQKQHLRLHVHNHICLNEFIIMLKQRFFNNENGFDNIDLEDIWLYKIPSMSTQNQQKNRSMIKLTYSLESKHECPLFAKNSTNTTQDWEQSKPNKEIKWKNSSLIRELFLYIKLNPKKSRRDQQALRLLTEEEKDINQKHFNSFTGHIHKTDMTDGHVYSEIYDDFIQGYYTFGYPPPKLSNDDEEQITVSDHDVEMINEEVNEDGITMQTPSMLEDVFKDLQKKKDEIQEIRAKFMFGIDQKIREEENLKYEEYVKNGMSMGPPAQKELDYLCFVKLSIPCSKEIQFKDSYLLDRIDQPLNIDKIYEISGVSKHDYDIFIDPMTNGNIRHQMNTSSSAQQSGTELPMTKKNQQQIQEQMSLEQYRQIGLIKFNQFTNDIYKIDQEIFQTVPFCQILPKTQLNSMGSPKPNKQGLCFILYPKLQPEKGCTEEDMERQQAQQFHTRLQWHENQVYVNLYYVHDMDGDMNQQRQAQIGTVQFNYLHTYEQILQLIVEQFLEARTKFRNTFPLPLDEHELEVVDLKKHIQMFSSNSNVISFQERMNSPRFYDGCQPILNIINTEHEVNFTIIRPKFENIDKEDCVRFKVFDDSSLVPSHYTKFLKLLVQRQS